MNNQNFVVTVRLSDVDENDQPDPICLPVEELATWRHFEALLQSMYVNPPAAIRVCYLDDESDWIELSSDSELQEAIKVAQDTDEILQLQVKRDDVNPHYVSTLNSLPSIATDGPHVTPLQTTYYKDTKEPLIYPHPSNTNTHSSLTHYPPSSPHSTQTVLQPLVYPYPNTDTPVDRPNENVLVMEANGKAASIHNRPDLSTQEKVQRLKTRLSSPKGEDKSLKGLNSCMSFGEMWQQASNYSSEEKVKFMKSIVTGECEGVGEKKVANSTKSKEEEQQQVVLVQAKEKSGLLIEPLSTEPVVSSSSLAVQDPFEVVCQDKPSRDLEQIQLNLQPGNILKPQKPNNSPGNSETDVAVAPKTAAINIERVVEQVHATAKPSLVKNNGGHNMNIRSSAVLVEVAPPVPRPLQMMEGAQSGANAVAIEIPEGYHHGAAQKEEDVTASGGAACTSASAETGESISNRPGHHGAAVSHKVKVPSGRHCGEAATFQHSGTSANRSSSKKGKKSESSKPSGGATGSKSKKDVVPKEASSSTTSTKRRSSSLQMKKRSKDKEQGGSLKEDRKGVKVEADVESGEKVVKVGDTSLQYQDFTMYMKRMKEDLHFHIVKDVTKKTDQLLRKTWPRSNSYDPSLTQVYDDNFEVVHKKIYCDSCNSCIRGIRYKCGNCADFDLCEKCEMTANNHDQSHVFLKLRRPVFMAGWIDNEKVPLLRVIIYKDDVKPVVKEKPKLDESLEDVPILSISEVATPGGKHSPLNTPSEPHRAESANWVWDSTFDTDHKLLYPLEGEGHGEAIRPFELLTPSKEGVDSQSRLSETEINRLITLLSIEEEAARKMSNTVYIDGEEEENETLHDAGTSHQPLLASAPPSAVCEECTVNGGEDVERQRISYSDDTRAMEEMEGNADIENNNDTFENQHHSQDEKESQTSGEFLEADEDFVELESDHSDENDDDDEEEEEREVVRPHHSNSRGDHSDSDTSDDFCILDPPSRDECEACIVEFPVVPPVKAQEEHSDQGDEDFHLVTDVSPTETVEHDQFEKEADDLVVEVNQEATPIEPVVAEVLNRMSDEVSREYPTHEEVAIEQNAIDTETTSNNMVDANDDDNNEVAATGGVSDSDREGSHKVVMSHHEEDVLINMSAEERCRFLDMVKSLKDRAEDLENELKTRKEAEAKEELAKQEEVQYQMILEEKQREAARENEKLEEQKRKEQEEKLRKQKQLEKERKARQRDLRHNAGTNRRESGTSTHSSTPTLMQMALIPRDKAASARKKSHDNGDESKPMAALTNVHVTKRDANCQTGTGGADAAAQASQMIQNVANGVTKAAEAAYHTAKDVFYSLQAKQVEKKEYPGVVYSKTVSNDTQGQTQEKVWTPPSSIWTPPTDTYVPPKSTWTPPSSEWKPPISVWTPPKSDWTGPKSEWMPPKSEWNGSESDWTPPKSQWNPPAGYYQQPDLESENVPAVETPESEQAYQQSEAARLSRHVSKDGDSTKSCDQPEVVKTTPDQDSLSTAPIPPIQPTQINDPVLRREVQGMQILIEMGFANREHNRRLLQKYDGDVEKAVQSLLQEEREEHWAFQRH